MKDLLGIHTRTINIFQQIADSLNKHAPNNLIKLCLMCALVSSNLFLSNSHADPDALVQLPLEEGSGAIATDISGQGNDGTLVNGPIYNTDTGNGSAFSVQFDGVDDYIDLGTLDVDGSGLTLAAWFKANSFPGSHNDSRLISKASGTASNAHVFMLSTIKVGTAVRLRARVRIGGTTQTLIASSGDLATAIWYHAATTYDGATLRLYLDGIEVGSTPLTGSVDKDPSLSVAVGSQPQGATRHFDGFLDDIQILQRALSASELQLGGNPGVLSASLTSINFGDVMLGGGSASQAIQFTNDGTTGDPDIVLSGAQITGSDAIEFSHDFAPTTLGPGQSMTLAVIFNPESPAGSKSATLEVTHNGNNSPASVSLVGNATEVGAPGDLAATPTAINFGDVTVGGSASQAVQLTHQGIAGDPDITLSSALITGSDAVEFSENFTSVTLAPGQSMTVTMNFNPADPTGSKSATLEVTHDGSNSPVSVPLAGNAVAGGGSGSTVVYRVNAGGSLLTDNPNWETDNTSNPSSNVNAGATGNKTFSTSSTIDLSDPSLAGDIPPAALFQSERWDPGSNPEMQWDFPVTPGTYEVRLYFAEIYSGAFSVGSRVFDVSIEGNLVLDDYDVFADVGSLNAVMKSFTITADSNLDIDFGHVIQNPSIKGIEILQIGDTPLILTATPTAINFGDVTVGGSASQAIQLTHQGVAGDPDITLSSALITGSDAVEFSENFASVTLAPGQSTTVTVNFNPADPVGSKSATLEVTHDGSNSPVNVPLTGNATAVGTPGDLGASVTSIDFGDVTIGAGASQAIELTNQGVAGDPDITLSSALITGSDAVEFSENFTSVTLAPGQSTTVTVNFNPADPAGSKSATLEVTHDGSNSPVNIPLTGNATAATPGDLAATPIAINFGNVTVGNSASQAIQFTHPGVTGDPDITLSSALITGSDAVEFSDNFASVTLAPGQSTTVTMNFNPADPAGSKSATLEMTHDGNNSPLNVPLSGNAVTAGGDPDLLVHLPMDEGSGTIATDISGQDNDGTLINGPAYNAASGDGSAFSVQFDGVDGYMDLGPLDVDGTGLTLAAWINADSFPGSSNDPRIISKASGTASNAHVFMLSTIKVGTAVRLRARVRVGGTTKTLIANSGDLATGTWYHTATTYDGAVLRLYLDGVEVGNTPLTGLVDKDPSLSVAVGSQPQGAARHFDGMIDDVKIFQRALSANELQQGGSTDVLNASPTSVNFGDVTVGNSASQAIQFTHPGVTGDPDIVLSSAQITGTDASEFNDNFASVTLQPGQSTTVTVSFNPADPTGSKSATFEVTHDGNNSPVNVPLTGNATAVGTPGDLGASLTSIDFGDVTIGASASQAIELTNQGVAGDPDIVLSVAQFTGSDSSEFSHNFVPLTLGPGESTTVTVNFNPLDPAGNKSATLEVTHNGNLSTLSVPLAGNAVAGGGSGSTVVYRVNAGGSLLTDNPDWETDTTSNPSSNVNAGATGNKTFSTGGTIDLSDPSLAGDIPPVALFQSERWDPSSNPEMQWDFPVTPGTYEVRLYFAEIYTGAFSVGSRVFDVSIEGNQVLDDYDVFADVGSLKAVMKSFTITADSNLNIDFGHVIENPAIKGIEIIKVGNSPNQLFVSPAQLNFGSVLLGSSSVQNIQLSNGGGSGDPDIVVNSTQISGPNPFDFTDGFTGPVTLGPGQSTTISVTFNPTGSAGSRSATLEVNHSGNNSPIQISLNGSGTSNIPISFGKSVLQGTSGLNNPTSLQFGPDDRLYVSEQNGKIRAYTITRNAANDYVVSNTETINVINTIPNHNDDGALNTGVNTRLITGILVTGTAANQVIYVNSSDPRIGGGPSGTDLNLDTNSGILSRLTWDGSQWIKLDLVRGLPRSEENHAPNGLQLDSVNNLLYTTTGGNTNHGAPSNNFGLTPEYALSTAMLEIDLDAIGETTYDLPTLNDEDRSGTSDVNDPFGGNNGKNQAKLVPGGPVQIYASGLRNAYDNVMTANGFFTIDNGGNAGWGNVPKQEGPAGNCTNQVNEPGVTDKDGLHFISGPGYYAGHPNPTRGNMANTFNNSNPQSPVSTSKPIECDYLAVETEDGALTSFPNSTNGITQYLATNFGGAMVGDLLAASFSNKIYRLVLNASGTGLASEEDLFSNVGAAPLDVTAHDDSGIFPGTIWVANIGNDSIVVFEPADFDGGGGPICTGADNPALDEDNDNYDNADEIDNGTDPCSAADVPTDSDGDFTSNLNDPDDDNDGLNDNIDPFAIDPNNGATTNLPVSYQWENDSPAAGGLLGLGFTGLMTNLTGDYETLFDITKMTAGGAAGVTTVDEVPNGDALGTSNNQQFAFQFGVNVDQNSAIFVAHTRIVSPFAGLSPQDSQSMGLFVGNGDQDNYFKIVVSANGGTGGIESGMEENGIFTNLASANETMPGPDSVDLYLSVDPGTLTVQARYAVTTSGTMGPITDLGTPQSIPVAWLSSTTKLAVGIISTSAGLAPTFPATWDFIEVTAQPSTTSSEAMFVIDPPGSGINGSTFGSGSFQITNNSQAGQNITSVEIDLSTAIFPDMVFDPDGIAGDTTAKAFTPNSGSSATGLVGHTLSSAHDDGFDVLQIDFNDFDVGEQFTFSIDVDPTSIRGVVAPGPNESGSVSGLELSGSTITVNFDDGTQRVAEMFRIPDSSEASENKVKANLPAQPGIEVSGVSTLPATVTDSNQTIRVTGPAGSDVSLLVIEGGLFTAGVSGGGFDLDPFEANSAVAVTEHTAVVGATGFVDIPVILTKSNTEAGLNYIKAVIRDIDGSIGANSGTVVLKFSPP